MPTRLLTTCLAVSTLVVSTLLVPIAARAADSDADRAHPVAFVQDSVITTKIKAKLAKAKMRSLTHISVDTENNGKVILSGSATTQRRVDQAVAIARGTEGVTSVQNDIRIAKDD